MDRLKKIIVTEELKRTVAESLANLPVLFAYLFGSVISDHIHKESDIDVAVFFDPNTSLSERFEQQLSVIGALANVLKIDSDLINTMRLNDAPHLLCLTVIREGIVLYEKNTGARLDFSLQVLQTEDDQRAFRRAYNAEYLKRLANRKI